MTKLIIDEMQVRLEDLRYPKYLLFFCEAERSGSVLPVIFDLEDSQVPGRVTPAQLLSHF